jgi:hypothetical protein
MTEGRRLLACEVPEIARVARHFFRVGDDAGYQAFDVAENVGHQ